MNEILSKLVVVSLSISLWTGRKKLSPEDLGLDFSKLPPEKLATLGSKKICDPEKLAVFSALKRRAERQCEAVGVRFLGGYAITMSIALSATGHGIQSAPRWNWMV